MKVFFAIPSYSGLRELKTIDALEATLKACESEGIQTGLCVLQGCCYVQMSRIKLVYEFMRSGADKLFFLDDDIEWDCKDALKLIKMEDDIVAGVYPYKKDFEDYPIVIHTHENGVPIVRDDGCIHAAMVPTGFLCISRAAIEKMIAAYPSKRFYDTMGGDKPVELYDLFPQGVDGERWVGEDYAFCKLWTQIGGQIWLVPNINFSHFDRLKNVEHKGNYHEFLLRQPRPA